MSKNSCGTDRLRELICSAAIKIQHAIRQAWQLGAVDCNGKMNLHGEKVQILDLFANQQFLHYLQLPGGCAGIVSEELDNFVAFENESSLQSPFICAFDPLDGSGNINVSISVGSIFSIYERLSNIGSPVNKSDFLQPGHKQVVAGYVLYGTATVLVFASHGAVETFILDELTGKFRLTQTGIHCPLLGSTYAVNAAYFFKYSKPVREYIEHLQSQVAYRHSMYTQRYTGSMVPDIHRTLLQGGLFMYPATVERPSGKLRLLYECNPIAFIIETAGGKATTGTQNILDMEPAEIHQRTPFFAGSACMIEHLLTYTQ